MHLFLRHDEFSFLRRQFVSKIANSCTRRRGNFKKGSHSMGDGRIFLQNLRASLFNDDLSNEPNLGRIHHAEQYL